MSYEVFTGNVLDLLPGLEPQSFDAVLCDPPYGLGFMGKAWDHGVPGEEVWRLVSAALKPGAPLLAFGGTRTYHRLACAIEDAGFEIRDSLCWLYGSGFPKSKALREVGPDWQGYGTALKPAWEPCILAMKPTDGTFAQNAEKWGVAGLNVDGGRIATDWTTDPTRRGWQGGNTSADYDGGVVPIHPASTPGHERVSNPSTLGRWPANVLLDEEAARMLDEKSGERRSAYPGRADLAVAYAGSEVKGSGTTYLQEKAAGLSRSDSGGASRFFYVAKASRSEREAGLVGLSEVKTARGNAAQAALRRGEEIDRADVTSGMGATGKARNHHPTVKPIKLCEYLSRLILPPKRNTPRRLLVPFSGSGSEMIGALLAGWDEVVGIEMEPEYVEIAEARLRHWIDASAPLFSESAAGG